MGWGDFDFRFGCARARKVFYYFFTMVVHHTIQEKEKIDLSEFGCARGPQCLSSDIFVFHRHAPCLVTDHPTHHARARRFLFILGGVATCADPGGSFSEALGRTPEKQGSRGVPEAARRTPGRCPGRGWAEAASRPGGGYWILREFPGVAAPGCAQDGRGAAKTVTGNLWDS